jgi:hypothetical protein
MYISDMTHFLNEKGNIPKEMPAEAREIAGFFAMVVDITTQRLSTILTPTTLRCFNKGCHGLINTTLKPSRKEIHWFCPECKNEGVISNWQGTKWDNIK